MSKLPQIQCMYCGPIAKSGKPARGGFEAANRKNIDELRRQGVKVTEIPNPVKPKGIGGALVYLKMLFTPLRLLKFVNKKNAVAHFTPIYGSLIYITGLGCYMASLLRVPHVVDIRAGSFMDIYRRKGKLYQRVIRSILNKADVVTVEGRPYLKSIGSLMKGKYPVYFPNLYAGEFEEAHHVTDTVNILYFGRITSNKGVEIIRDAFLLLGNDFTLTMAGPVADDVDIKTFEDAGVSYLGMLNPKQLAEVKRNMHFFLFPTTHSGEGQSNALIEAMASGLIPIVSDNGFNRDVVGDAGVILPVNASAKDYADAVRSIVSADRIPELSKKAIDRISEGHDVSTEIAKLLKSYQRICQ